MNRLLRLLLLLFVPMAASATTTVSGTMQNLGTGAVGSNAFMRFWLRGCGGNQPRVSGTALIAPSQGGVFYFDFPANASGVVSGTLYSTRDVTGNNGGDIQCGTSTTAVWYGMQAFYGGKGGPEVPVHAKNTTTLDITQVSAITTNPVVTSPTGDTTYARLDGGNQPFLANVTPSGNGTLNLGSTLNRWKGFFGAVDMNGGSLTGTISGAPTWSGNPSFTGLPTAKSLNNVLYADQYTNVQAAMNACQSLSGVSGTSGGTAGCTIYATSAAVNTALGTLDPGANTVPITIYLGPFDFTADHIVLRADFKIMGSGYYTTITSVGLNSQNLIVFPQSNNIAVMHVVLADFRAFGASLNTSQEGLSLDVSGLTTSQLSYSRFQGLEFHGFKGPAIHIKGPSTSAASAVQFDWFEGLYANRPSGGTAPVVKLEGYTAQLKFETSEFDGFSNGDGADNIYLGVNGASGTVAPLTVYFDNVTTQNGSNGYHFGGAQNVVVNGGHSEQTPTPFLFTQDSGSIGSAGNQNVVIRQSYIAGTSGATAVLTDNDSNATPSFEENWVAGAVGAFINGTSATNVKYCNNKGTGANTGCNIATAFASGTAAMTTALIAAGACGTTVSVGATGVVSTDAITWSFNATPGNNPGVLTVTAWPSAGNVNFAYCNSNSSGVTPNAATLNWQVRR